MDKIYVLIPFALLSVFVILPIKKYSPVIALAASVCAGTMILIFVLDGIIEIKEQMSAIGTVVDAGWIGSVIKITLISFIGQWGIQLCRDAGENSVADKCETAVKILVTVICLPYIEKLFELVTVME